MSFSTRVAGHSTDGRPIWVESFGTTGPTVLLICGIHGNETSSVVFGDQLRSRLLGGWAEARNVRVLLVQAANPDGLAAGTRLNADGIDINRDFPAANADGPRAPVAPETRLLRRLVEAAAPAAILSIHCCEPLFDWDGPARTLAETMAAAMPDDLRFPVERLGAHPGSLGSWAGHDLGLPTVTVEFDCHGPTDIRRQLDAVEESVDAALHHLAGATPEAADSPATDLPDADAAALRARRAGTSAGGHPIRLEIAGPDTRPALLIIGGLADNDLRGRAVAEYLRRTLFCRLDGPTPVAALTAANPDGIATGASTNADGVDIPDDVADATDRSPEADTVVRAVEQLDPHLVVTVETDDRADSAAGLGLEVPDTPLATGGDVRSPVARRLADLGPPVLRLGVHRRTALGRDADDVPNPGRFVDAIVDAT